MKAARKACEQVEALPTLSPPALAADVEQLITFLGETVQPEKIFLLSHPALDGTEAAGYVDLLVVVPCRSHILFAEHQGLVEFSNLRTRHVVCSLHRADAVRTALAQGHIYYSLACTPEKLVYDNGSDPFPSPPPHLYPALGEKARKVFYENHSRAKAFYACARSCAHAPVAAFLLHQAAELTYRAIQLSLMKKDVHTHSIKALIKHSRRCAPQLNCVFPRDTPEEKHLVHQLEEAYLKSRYEPGYTLDKAVLGLLTERVGELLYLARQVFDARVQAFEQELR